MQIPGKYLTITVLSVAATVSPVLWAQDPVVIPPVRVALTAVTPEAVIPVDDVVGMSVSADAVWVSRRTSGTLTRIDPKTNMVSTGAGGVVPGDRTPCHPVVWAFASVWTSWCSGPGLARVDTSGSEPKTTVITTAIPAGGPMVSGTGSIWMLTGPSGPMVRIDPDTNAVVAEVAVPEGAAALAFGHESIWVVSSTRDVVTRINSYSHVVIETIKVGRTPSAVAVGEGGVWVWNAGDGTVSRIDPETNKVTTTIKAAVRAPRGTLVAGEGAVWVSAPGFPLTRIDPASNRVTHTFTGVGGGVLAIGAKSLWLPAANGLLRIDPKRAEATRDRLPK